MAPSKGTRNTMQEEWRSIPAFPKYSVSNLGQVENQKTGRILSPTVNQQGHLKVNLMRDGVIHTRNVNQLVAKAFLNMPIRKDFISVIHLDGDKQNCGADNLAWRTRYFAVRYHQQFDDPRFHSNRTPVLDVKAGIEYESAKQAALAHGLVYTEILYSAMNRTVVWPTYQEFRILA